MNWKRVVALVLALVVCRSGYGDVAIKNVGSVNVVVSFQGGYTYRTITPGSVYILSGYTGTLDQPGNVWHVNLYVNTAGETAHANYHLPDNYTAGALRTWYSYHTVNGDTYETVASWGIQTNTFGYADLGWTTNTDNLYHKVIGEIWTNNTAMPSDTNRYLAYTTNWIVAPGGALNWSFTNANYGTSGYAKLYSDAGSLYASNYINPIVLTNTSSSWSQGYTELRDMVPYIASTQNVTFPTYTAGTRSATTNTAGTIAQMQEFNAQARFTEQMTQDRNMFNLNRMADNALLDTVGNVGYQAHSDAVNALAAAQSWGALITNAVLQSGSADRSALSVAASSAIESANNRLVALTNYLAALSNQRAIEAFNSASNAAAVAGYNTTVITNAIGGVERAIVNSDGQLQYLTNLITGQKELMTVGNALNSNQWVMANGKLSETVESLRSVAESASNTWAQSVASASAMSSGLSNVVAAIKESGSNSPAGYNPGAVNTNSFTASSKVFTNRPSVKLGDSDMAAAIKSVVPMPGSVGNVAPSITIPLGSLGVGGLSDYVMDFSSDPYRSVVVVVRGFLFFLMTWGFCWHVLRVVGMVGFK